MSTFLVLVALQCTSCGPYERLVTDEAAPISTYTCTTGTALLVAFINDDLKLVSCPEGSFTYADERWNPIEGIGPVTAWLPTTEKRSKVLVATQNGELAWLSPKGKTATPIALPPQKPDPKEGILYSYRPGGLAKVSDATVTALYEVDEHRLIAVSAGIGAWASEDHGQNWRVLSWLQRFRILDGSRPLEVQNLIISDDDLIALLYYPEGRAIASEQLQAQFDAKRHNTEKGGGPLVANGHLASQNIMVRAVPLGSQYDLMQAPGFNGNRLWLMVSHHERHEMTRFLSRDWGESYFDVGYFNSIPLAVDDSTERTAILSLTDNDDTVIWLPADSELHRYAFVTLPEPDSTATLLLSLASGTTPEQMLLARGKTAILYDISHVGPDVRLLWYYLPLGLLTILSIVLAIRRFNYERRLRAERKKEREQQRIAWEQHQKNQAASETPEGEPQSK